MYLWFIEKSVWLALLDSDDWQRDIDAGKGKGACMNANLHFRDVHKQAGKFIKVSKVSKVSQGCRDVEV